MAGVITTASHPKALWPGIKAWWGQTYAEHVTEYTDLFDTDTSSQNYEEDVQLTGFGLVPVKNQAAGVSYDSEVQGFVTRYTHVAYAMGYIVTKEEQDDNLYEKVSRNRAAALAMSFRQTKENIGANVFNRAFNATYLGGDGVALCSTAHPNTTGGTFANRPAVDADLGCADLFGPGPVAPDLSHDGFVNGRSVCLYRWGLFGQSRSRRLGRVDAGG